MDKEFVLYTILLLVRFFETRFGALRYGVGAVIDALDSGAIGDGSDRPLSAEDVNM
jgi:hypothetical protein